MNLRSASRADREILTRMVCLAADWRPEAEVRDGEAVVADEHLVRYVEGWPRSGDVGVVAVDDEGRVMGAAWSRLFEVDAPGYGFVDPETPEVSVAVEPDRRGRGVGEALLRELIRTVGDGGVDALSLSVESDNPARHLYERLGFEPVGPPVGGAVTMRLALTEPRRPTAP